MQPQPLCCGVNQVVFCSQCFPYFSHLTSLNIILFNCSIVIKTIAKFRHWIPGPRKKKRTDLTMQGISHHCQLSLIHAFPNIIAYPTCVVYSFTFLTVSSLAIPPNWSAHTFPIFKEVLTFL